MHRLLFRALALSALVLAPVVRAQTPDPNAIVVQVNNKSDPELCAERDNVALEFVSPEVRRFKLQAVPPA